MCVCVCVCVSFKKGIYSLLGIPNAHGTYSFLIYLNSLNLALL